jgi:hypothetical protein
MSIQLSTSQPSKVSPKVLRWALAPLVSATTLLQLRTSVHSSGTPCGCQALLAKKRGAPNHQNTIDRLVISWYTLTIKTILAS